MRHHLQMAEKFRRELDQIVLELPLIDDDIPDVVLDEEGNPIDLEAPADEEI